jgi:hypothetical protein
MRRTFGCTVTGLCLGTTLLLRPVGGTARRGAPVVGTCSCGGFGIKPPESGSEHADGHLRGGNAKR